MLGRIYKRRNKVSYIFIENGYERKILESIVKNYQPNNNNNDNSTDDKKYVSLPFVPGIDKKLKNVYHKAGLKVMFKSGKSLQSLLTARNKPKLPNNSYPGVYRVPCQCGGNYTGQSGKKVCTRFGQHDKAIIRSNWNDSALSYHTKDCEFSVNWDNAFTVNTEPCYYRRCIRESLEIQKEEVGPNGDKIINKESGLYVTTKSWLPLLKKISQ